MTKKYDVDDLNGISEGLSTLSGELADLSEDSGKAQTAIWSSPLVEAVQEFTDNWDKHRMEIIESLDVASQALSDIAGAYDTYDTDAAGKLDEE